jgi:hypothetical protein
MQTSRVDRRAFIANGAEAWDASRSEDGDSALERLHRATLDRPVYTDSRQTGSVHTATDPVYTKSEGGSSTRRFISREDWHLAAVTWIFPYLFEPIGIPARQVRVSCSWPLRGGLAKKSRVFGECWLPDDTPDGIAQIKISPVLEEPGKVLATLVHELIHAILPADAGHGPAFRAVAHAVGFVGPLTKMTPGDDLACFLEEVAHELGPYPHRALGADCDNSAAAQPVDAPQKQEGSRMLKLECPCCGYPVRTTRKWVDQGRPLCPLDGYALQEVPTSSRSTELVLREAR